MSMNYGCGRCSKPSYNKHLKPYIVDGEKVYLCKDCRVKLGFEKYDKWTDPFQSGAWGNW